MFIVASGFLDACCQFTVALYASKEMNRFEISPKVIIVVVVFMIGLLVALPLLFSSPATADRSSSSSAPMAPRPEGSLFIPMVSRGCASSVNIETSGNVSPTDLDEIRFGFCMVQEALREDYGGDIPEKSRKSIPILVVNDPSGNQVAGEDGACCTALDDSGARLIFDVSHENWRTSESPGPWSLRLEHEKTAAHTYVHAWQNELGCLSLQSQPLGDWFTEGTAEYIAFQAFIRKGQIEAAEVQRFQLDAALYTGEAHKSLDSLEHSQELWPVHIGYLAVEALASRAGTASLRAACEAAAGGSTFDEAFQKAFGLSKESFYASFPEYLSNLRGR